jgi:hypothetical protein
MPTERREVPAYAINVLGPTLGSSVGLGKLDDRLAVAESVSDSVLTYSRSLRIYRSPQHFIWPLSLTACKIRHMKRRSALLQFLIVFAAVGSSYAAELDQQALAAWENYIASVKVRMQKRLNGKSPFLWVDEDLRRRQQLDSGGIVISPVGNSHLLSIPHGLIHHWIGAVFVRGTTIQDLSAVVGDYGRCSEMYRPTLIKAELLDSTGDEQKFSILWVQRVLLVTAAYYSQLGELFCAR